MLCIAAIAELLCRESSSPRRVCPPIRSARLGSTRMTKQRSTWHAEHDGAVSEDDLDRISRAIGAIMRVAESERVHAARQRGAGINLSRTDMRFLAAVDEHGPAPVTVLGRFLHVSQPTASRTLSRLESEGLVRQVRDDPDGRVTRYCISTTGRAALRRFRAYMKKQLDQVLSGMPTQRRRDLADLLEQFVAGTGRPINPR